MPVYATNLIDLTNLSKIRLQIKDYFILLMDAFIDIWKFLTRNDLEKYQMVNRQWFKLINVNKKILPIRLLKLKVTDGFECENKANFFLIPIGVNYLDQVFPFNDFYAQQKVLLNACAIHKLRIKIFKYKDTKIKKIFEALKQLSKTIKVYKTTLTLFNEDDNLKTDIYYNFWPKYFNGEIVSTKIFKLNAHMSDMIYYLANLTIFNVMEKGTKIYLAPWLTSTYRMPKEYILKNVDMDLYIELFKLELCFYPNMLTFIVESFMDNPYATFLFEYYSVTANNIEIKLLSKRYPLCEKLLSKQKECNLKRKDGWKLLVKEETCDILTLKFYQ